MRETRTPVNGGNQPSRDNGERVGRHSLTHWPCPRATKKFEQLYKGRTSVERVNGRLKVFWGIDDGNVKGSRRFHAWVGDVMAVHAAFATLLASAPRFEGSLSKLRLSPIARALQAHRQSREQQDTQSHSSLASDETLQPA